MAEPIMQPARDPETGAWQYPATWSPEARSEWEAQAEELAAEERRMAKIATDAHTSATDPARLLARQRADLAERKRLREAREQEAGDDRAWDELAEKHGGHRLRRIYSDLGSIIVRGMTEPESSAIQRRVDGVVASALEAGDERRAASDAVKAYQEGVYTVCVLHPKVDRARQITAAFPGLWPELYAARDELNRGRREALGKGAAR